MASADNPNEYGKFLSRALTAYGNTLAESDLYYMPQLIGLHAQMEEIIRQTVKAQLLSGASWAAIGEALGVPTATARSRYGVEGYGKSLVVYGLKLEEDSEIRYVGKTKNLGLRLSQHRSSANLAGHSKVAKWIREVGIENIEPVILQRYETESDLTGGEIFWYEKLLSEGNRLTNGGRPGDDRKTQGAGGRPRKPIEKVIEQRNERIAQRAKDDARQVERRRAQEVEQERSRIERSGAWWAREVAAGRAHVIQS